MAVKKVYVSDLSGKDITGAHKTISINRKETKKYSTYYGRGRTYTATVAKVFHIAEDEIDLLPKAIRDYVFPPKVEKEKKPAKSDKKVSS